jgi:hypothetical protein
MTYSEVDVYMWRYPETVGIGDVTGYTIHATDGEIGKVDKANNETDSHYLVVKTGPWIFGKTVMLPAGVLSSVDRENETVHVGITKEQIKNAPEYSEGAQDSEDYRGELGRYYGAQERR